MTKRLLVIIPDQLSDLVKKGEVTERYYNPGNYFEEVHLLVTNEDRPALSAIQPMVGDAKLFLHHLPLPSAKKTLYWQPLLLKKWVRLGIEMAEKISPSFIRCHGDHVNCFLASEIKKELKVPMVVSLHNFPDDKAENATLSPKAKLIKKLMEPMKRRALRAADRVLPVYHSIVPYLDRLGVERKEVAYNVISPNVLSPKTDYALHSPVKILCVGRQIPVKNPVNIVLAMKSLPNCRLTLIGEGPLHLFLKDLIQKEKLQDRVEVIPSLSNVELCRSLKDYDIFAVHCAVLGISKTLMEALITGLPCIVNLAQNQMIPEYEESSLLTVTDTAEGYLKAIEKLISDSAFREKMGREAHRLASLKWHPEKAEANYVSLYRNLLESRVAT